MYIRDESNCMQFKTAGDLKNWSRLKGKYRNCCDCNLSATRKYISMYRGSIPCDILFIGLHPSKSDDLTGVPFSDPKQWVLLTSAVNELCMPHDIIAGFTNLLACTPPKATIKLTKQIAACSNRLVNTIRMVSPKGIIVLGDTASTPTFEMVTRNNLNIPVISTYHPSLILGLQDPIRVKAATHNLRNRIETIVDMIIRSRK